MSSFQVLDENCSHYPEAEAQEFREVCAEVQARESLLYTPTAQNSSGLLPQGYCEVKNTVVVIYIKTMKTTFGFDST